MVDTVYLDAATAPNAVTASADGTSVQLVAGNAGDTGVAGTGGHVILSAGTSAYQAGTVQISGGDGVGDGAPGWVQLQAGYGGAGNHAGGLINIVSGWGGETAGAGGDIQITARGAANDGDGGSVVVIAGDGQMNGDGGNINLTPGAKAGAGGAGHVLINNLQNFADDATAATGGVPVGGLYRTSSAIKVRVA